MEDTGLLFALRVGDRAGNVLIIARLSIYLGAEGAAMNSDAAYKGKQSTLRGSRG